MKSLSRVRLFATPWMVAYQPPRSMGFSRQEYWSGLPFPSPGDLPNPGIETGSPLLLLLLSRFSRVRLCATPQTAAHQAPPSTGFSRQEYWSGVPFPSPGDLPNPGIEHGSPPLQADALPLFPFVTQVAPFIFVAPVNKKKKKNLPLLS